MHPPRARAHRNPQPQGTLRQTLDDDRLRDPSTGLTSLRMVLSLAHNVASAMQYLHEESILREWLARGRPFGPLGGVRWSD